MLRYFIFPCPTVFLQCWKATLTPPRASSIVYITLTQRRQSSFERHQSKTITNHSALLQSKHPRGMVAYPYMAICLLPKASQTERELVINDANLKKPPQGYAGSWVSFALFDFNFPLHGQADCGVINIKQNHKHLMLRFALCFCTR